MAGLALGACSRSDDDGGNQTTPQQPMESYTETQVEAAPQWGVDWSYNQGRPDWQAPEAASYETWNVMMVEVEDELKPTTTPRDLMAVFIDGELRALASPATDLSEEVNNIHPSQFIMKVRGNEPDQYYVNITVKYYSDSLQHVFSRSTQVHYSSELVLGVEEELIPQFTLGSSKYPVVGSLDLAQSPLAKAGITPAEGDKLAVFAGDECRGTYKVDEQLLQNTAIMPVFGRQTGESYTLKYYRQATNSVLTFNSINVE